MKMQGSKNWPYEDIVNLPHHTSRKHPRMDMEKRAAQFAPFAALTGYGDAVEQTARKVASETEEGQYSQEEEARYLRSVWQMGENQ